MLIGYYVRIDFAMVCDNFTEWEKNQIKNPAIDG